MATTEPAYSTPTPSAGITNDPESVPDDLTVEYGRSGTLNWRGFLQSDEYNRKLLPPESFLIYDRMAKSDPVVHATMQHIITPLLAAEWECRPASSDPQHLEQAAFVQQNLDRWMERPWVEVLEDALRYLRHGVSVTEATYKWARKSWSYVDPDGKDVTVAERDVLIWRDWAPRLPRTIWKWNADEHGKLESIEQNTYDTRGLNQSIVTLPIDKCLVLVNEQEGDDYWGVSLLRGAYKPWFMLEGVQRVAAIGMEKFLVGTPVVRMKNGASANQRHAALEMLMNIRSGEQTAVVYSEDLGFDCGNSEPSPCIRILAPDRDPPDALPLIRHLESNIFTNILARFMDLGQRETGARATAEVQRDPFFLGLIAVANKVSETINRGFVRQLIDLNYPGVHEYPTLKATGISPQDIPVIARAAQLWAAGGFLTPDAPTEQWIREQTKMPNKVFTGDEEARYAASAAMAQRYPAAANPDGTTSGGAKTSGGKGGAGSGTNPGAREGGDTSDDLGLAEAAWSPSRPFRPDEAFTDWHGASALIDATRDQFVAAVDLPLLAISDRLVEDAIKAVESGDPRNIARLRSRELGPLAEAIRGSLMSGCLGGAESMRQELGRMRDNLPIYEGDRIVATPGYSLADDNNWLKIAREMGGAFLESIVKARGEQVVASLVNTLESIVKRLALSNLRKGRMHKEQILKEIQREVGAAARKEANLAASESFNTGRSAVLREAGDNVDKVTYSAILDRNCCPPCRLADGHVTTFGSPSYIALDPPNPSCEGGDRCRCTWTASLA